MVDQTDRPTISILVPCYNEEAVLNKFYERISEVVANITNYEFEFVFVNDGRLTSLHEITAHYYDDIISRCLPFNLL